MTDRPSFDAWLVDLDGTLYRPFPVKVAMAAELGLVGLHVATVLRAFRREHERVRLDPKPDTAPFEDQLHRAAQRTGRDVREVRALVMEWMFERPGKYLRRFRRESLIVEIRDYRTSGGKTALVSDYPARAKLGALAASDLFDVVVASGEPGGPARLKPDPAGYLKAAELLGVPPDRALVIGDRADADGEAATRAGMGFRLV